MAPTDMLRDLWVHHAWADAEHWRAFEAFPAASRTAACSRSSSSPDESAWVWAISDRTHEFVLREPGDFTPRALKAFAVRHHQALALTGRLDELALDCRIGIPWFTNPPLELSVREGLTQVAMHSHYHRGQNATRLRELGGDPPGTDLITWIGKGRPSANW